VRFIWLKHPWSDPCDNNARYSFPLPPTYSAAKSCQLLGALLVNFSLSHLVVFVPLRKDNEHLSLATCSRLSSFPFSFRLSPMSILPATGVRRKHGSRRGAGASLSSVSLRSSRIVY